MKKLLTLLVFVLVFGQMAIAEQVVLDIYWENDSFSLEKVYLTAGEPKTPKNGTVYSRLFCVSQDKAGAPLAIQEVFLPDMIYYDGLDTDGNLQGGQLVPNSGQVVLRLPHSDDIQKVSLYKSWAKSVSLSSLNDKSFDTREPQAVFELPKKIEPLNRLTYTDVGDVHKIIGEGPDSNRFVVAILAEGYTTSQQSDFLEDAATAMNRLFGMEPWSDYSSYVNVYAVEVFSQQSGSDHPESNPAVYVNTAFQSTYNHQGLTRFLVVPTEYASKVYGVAGEEVPNYDTIVVLVNDTTYGGSGGPFSVISTNYSSGELAAHEMGHSVFGLGDEYESAGGTSSGDPEPNIENDTTLSLIKWNHWIEDGTPIPTPEVSPYLNIIGLFEGAKYRATGYYRPKYSCKMRGLGDEFCEVCQETHVVGTYRKSFYKVLNLVEGASPAEGAHQQPVPNVNFGLTVHSLQTASNTVKCYWYVDDVLVPSLSGATVQIPSDLIPDGQHNFKVIVRDESDRVRLDPEGFTTEQVEWTFDLVTPSNVPQGIWNTY